MKKGDKIYKNGITLEVAGVKGQWVLFYVQNGSELRAIPVKMKVMPTILRVA